MCVALYDSAVPRPCPHLTLMLPPPYRLRQDEVNFLNATCNFWYVSEQAPCTHIAEGTL